MLVCIPRITIKRSCPHSNFFSIYPTSYSLKYINDFSNISIISPLISTIFSLYRPFDTGYRLTGNFRQPIYALYPATTIKRSYPTATSFPHTPSSTNRIISTIFQIYRSFLHLYQRFFHYINGSTQDIDLTTTFDTRNAPHTLSPKQLTAELYD